MLGWAGSFGLAVYVGAWCGLFGVESWVRVFGGSFGSALDVGGGRLKMLSSANFEPFSNEVE